MQESTSAQQNALILGAGIIGLCSAYYLQQAGFNVTVIDQENEVGRQTSYANGAQLSYSYVAPLAAPGVLSQVPKWLLNPDAPMRLKPSLNPADICWGIRFAKACTAEQNLQTTKELLSLSFLSRDLFHELFEEIKDVDFDCPGKLVVHRNRAHFESAVKQLEIQRALGCEQEALNTEQCVEKEPSLAPLRSQIVGGIWTPSEEVVDSYKLSVAIRKNLEAKGVKFLLGERIRSLETVPGSTGQQDVEVVLANGQRLTADAIVVALGSFANELLGPVQVNVPVGPLKGYSLTLDIEDEKQAPYVSITDYERKVVYARIGNRLRIAGMADRVGLDRSLDPKRIKTLVAEAKRLFPGAGNYADATQWAGLRPATPKGKPIIDKTKYGNLWLNVGHGALGLTLASGSGKLLADMMSGNTPSISPTPFRQSEA
ncbi:MAG: D-amino acid dehydrogenase [Alcaligenaceae bacterium]|nr:D-amino acid dehydrogenase [Alcaligenaceae bacterium]HZJ96758.1 D-amino acid dehydrogenase [Oligella sp.]